MRVIILHSALPENAPLDEQETMLQAQAVFAALKQLGHEVSYLAVSEDFCRVIDELRQAKPEVVFNLVESIAGKSNQVHLVPLLLDHLNIPYTGANANTLLFTTDKVVSKQWLKAGNLPTPAWLLPEAISHTELTDYYIVKSILEDGSLGIDQHSIAKRGDKLRAIIDERERRFGGTWFAEKFIHGREFNISLLPGKQGMQVLPIAEMQFTHLPAGYRPLIDYAAKWETNSEIYNAMQRSFDFPINDHGLLQTLTRLAEACSDWFKLSSYARIDFRVDEAGCPWILELNLNPSIAPDAGFAAAAQQAGIDYNNLIAQLVASACSSH